MDGIKSRETDLEMKRADASKKTPFGCDHSVDATNNKSTMFHAQNNGFVGLETMIVYVSKSSSSQGKTVTTDLECEKCKDTTR